MVTTVGGTVTDNMAYFYDYDGRLVRVENLDLIDSPPDLFSLVRPTPVSDVLNFNRRLTYYSVNNPIIPSS